MNVTPAGNLAGVTFRFILLSFPHRHHLCPGSKSAQPFVPIPPIAVARSSTALRPTPREWVLSPSLRSSASFRAWSLWPHLPSLTVPAAVPSGTPGARLVRSSHRLCTRVYVQTRARGVGRDNRRDDHSRRRLLGGPRAPPAPADLDHMTAPGQRAQMPVNGRPGHSGSADKVTDRDSFQRCPA
jgi:hypothetical protein